MHTTIDLFIEGIATGVIIAIILGAYHFWAKKRLEKEQIQYIRDVISKCYEVIKNAQDYKGKPRDIPKEAIRFVFYKEMVEDLKLALTDRSNDLSYEKKHDIKKVLRFHDEVLGKEGLSQGKPPSDMGIYEMLFDKFKKLTWLGWGPDQTRLEQKRV